MHLGPSVFSTDERLLESEFDCWAKPDVCDEMQHNHLYVTVKAIEQMGLKPSDRVLDLGCGSGWTSRLLSEYVDGQGISRPSIVGVDISEAMVRLAREQSKGLPNVSFVHAAASHLEFESGEFDKVLSVESFYYYPDQSSVLQELLRILKPGGDLFILIALYSDNPFSLQWIPHLKIPVQVHSSAHYVGLLEKCGFSLIRTRQIRDLTPVGMDYEPVFFDSLADMLSFKRIGALLLAAKKPNVSDGTNEG